MNILPRISVIIPVYNTEKYLRKCLDSVLIQSFDEIEVICVNDGSTDASISILREYEQKDNRVRVFCQANSGLGASRNFGIKKARGEYVIFVDSDDMLIPNCLNVLYDEACINGLNVLSSEIEVQYENEKLKTITHEDYYKKNKVYNYVTSGRCLFADMIKNNDFCISANLLFINREWMIREGVYFPEGIFFEDAIFCLKCYSSAKKIKHINYRSYVYHVRSSSIMTSEIDEKRIISWLEVFRFEVVLLLKDNSDILFQSALIKFIRNWYSYIRNISLKYTAMFDMKLSPQYSLLRLFLGLEKNDDLGSVCDDEKLLLLGFETMVENSGGAIIYGAGELGLIILKYLSLIKKKHLIKCFAVSSKDGKEKSIRSIPIYTIDDCKDSDSLIILAANEKNQKAMVRKLRELNLNNYYTLSDKVKFSIKRRMLNEASRSV